MKKKLAMLLAATMLVTLFTGCGAGGKEDKGELNLYTWTIVPKADLGWLKRDRIVSISI
mgnify:CR=1 FL=1